MRGPASNKVRQMLTDVPRVDVTSAIDGLRCKIVGRLWPGSECIISPFFRQSCVAYQLTVRWWDDEDGWSTALDEQKLTDFWVTDTSGPAYVQAQRAALHVITTQECERSTGWFTEGDCLSEEEQRHLKERLRCNGSSLEPIRGQYRLEITERRLAPSSMVAVEGIPTHDARFENERSNLTIPTTDPFRRSVDPARHNPKHILCIDAGRSRPVYVSDDPATFD